MWFIHNTMINSNLISTCYSNTLHNILDIKVSNTKATAIRDRKQEKGVHYRHSVRACGRFFIGGFGWAGQLSVNYL